jgi:hypothetical protein
MSDIEIIQLTPYQLPGAGLKSIRHCSAPSNRHQMKFVADHYETV